MQELILVIDILAGVGVIGLVLLQQGKGADMGAGLRQRCLGLAVR